MIGLTGMPLPDFAPGSVWLTGAGPGDPGLLTVLALHALTVADVIVHDALVESSILALAPPTVERYDVGKRSGRISPQQKDITTMLVSMAHRGHRVLRLKGGDPFMFGRGQEEIAGLSAAGIPTRVIPGLTSGIAGPAAVGMALTGRDNQAVTFMTGTGPDGAVPSLDWRALVRGAQTLVFYMALRQLGEITHCLSAAGLPADEPVAVLCEATTPRQQVLFSSLSQVATAAATLQPPAIVVIGPGARCSLPANYQ
ncbi:Uroporphyrinogen-III methyltransferase [invertebrate metagenome]|uniref:uroporphyrinogen-III C-methyltransferase n=1 Tax=invertebrate metagenome TaxID=1711999 RepID=A0A484HA93_9ZZZZ